MISDLSQLPSPHRYNDQRTVRIPAHDNDVNSVCFLDSSTQVLASAADDGLCKVWDRRALREDDPVPVGELAGHVDGLTYVSPKGDGRYLITNSKDQTIKLWDLRKFSGRSAVEESRRAVTGQRWDYRMHKIPKTVVSGRRRVEGDTQGPADSHQMSLLSTGHDWQCGRQGRHL